MAIDVGHILDKYELIEKVGQGGMAVVYRGLDHSLHREVAIKILHTHLADFQEARDRFAREARAVAKLRHDNILEIFDFSGGESDSSYIVTEFIEGQTLAEIIAERKFAYPEIGAMIVVDVCRALAHAHELGVLHRDVKPENIMIREDGAVKLMDFGIAQMLDMQRLTVTGQLLGSPAYMAPEHVTGDQLDFRTDVFAVGIVLYQLTVGALPFQGKNPHELLKRIAEGVYRDPMQVQPLIGKTLGRIIERALMRHPDERFATASDMQAALERYLQDECGIADYRRELAAHFADPDAHERDLGARLTDHLATRGKEQMARDPVEALECFNRVLTMDPERQDVLDAMERMSRQRQRWRKAAIVGAILACALAASALFLFRDRDSRSAGEDPQKNAQDQDGMHAPATQIALDTPRTATAPASAIGARASDAGPSLPALPALLASPNSPDASAATDTPATDQHEDERNRRPIRSRVPHGRRGHASDADADRRTDQPSRTRRFVLKVAQRRSEYRLDQGPWIPIDGQTTLDVGEGAHTVEVQNRTCCQNESRRIRADEPGGVIAMDLSYMPANITPRCDQPGVIVQIDDRPADLGQPNVVVMRGGLGVEKVRVTFIGERIDTHTMTVRYKEHVEVQCRL